MTINGIFRRIYQGIILLVLLLITFLHGNIIESLSLTKLRFLVLSLKLIEFLFLQLLVFIKEIIVVTFLPAIMLLPKEMDVL